MKNTLNEIRGIKATEYIKEVQDNQTTQEARDRNFEIQQAQYEKEANLIHEKYSKIIEEISDERRSKSNEVYTKKNANRTEHDKEIDALKLVYDEVAQIIKLLKLQEYANTQEFKEGFKLPEDLPKEDILFQDDYLILWKEIIGNGNKVNMHTLNIEGKCLFSRNMTEFQKCFFVKDGKSVEDLNKYFLRNYGGQNNNLRFYLNNVIEEYKENKEIYLQTIHQYTLEDFKALLVPKAYNQLDYDDKKKIREDYCKHINIPAEDLTWNSEAHQKIVDYYMQNKEVYGFLVYSVGGYEI